MAITRIKENQITDLAVTNAKIANSTIAGGKMAANLSYGSNLTITGNLTVSGTTTSVATTNTRIDDAILVLANGTSGNPSEDSGFIIDRGDSNNMAFLWDETADVFILVDVGAEDGDTVGNVTVSGTRQTLQMGPLVATTGTFSGVVAATGFTIGSAVIAESELEMIDGITAGTAAASKAVVLDSSTNITGIGTISCGVITATGFTIGSAVINEAELETIDGVTVGTAIASKVVTTNSDIDTTGQRNLTISGELDAATLDISGNADIDGTLEADAYTVDGTALNEYIADTVGAMVTSNTETNIAVTYQDGDNTLDFVIGTLNQDTSGTAALATTVTVTANNSTDEVVYPVFVDGATGTQGAETDTGLSYNPSTGVLTTTSVTGNLTGNVTGNTSGTAATVTTAAQPNITSLGTLTTLTVDSVKINGAEIGFVSSGGDDTDLMTLADGVLTIAGELDAATLDISGNADIDGTLEADAYTVDGVALNEYISDTVGAMVGSNTETGIAVTYQDGDNTLDFVVATLNQDTTGTATKVTVTDSSANTNFPVTFHDESNGLLDDTGALRYNPSSGTLLVPNLTVAGTTTQVNTVTMNAANAIIFEGATADSHETTLSIVDPTADRTQYLINLGGYIPVLAAVTTTAISSTPAELNLLDGSSANSVVSSKAVIYGSSGELAGTLSTAAQGNVTSLGTLTTLTVDDIIINGANIGHTSDINAIAIASNGVVTMDQIPVFSAGINVSGGTIAGTLATAAQTNITSLGTLTALTVDDVVINGKVMTMTGSSSDTAVMTVATNGAFSLVTTDDAAAAANIQITADGTAELAGTTVTLNSGAGITLDADNGTITFADAGSSLGTITSSGYTGNVVGNVTGNTSGTAATVTTAAQPNITSLGTLTTLTVDSVKINGAEIGFVSSGGDDTDLMTLADSVLTVAGVVAASGFTIGSAVIAEAELETIDGITAGTAAASKAVVLDGSKNIATIGTIGCGAITSSGVVSATGFTIGSAVIVEAELETIDGVTAGTVAASKAVVVDSSLDIASFRNVSMTGNLNVTDAGAVRVGTGNDLQISHNGTDTTIANTTGIMAFNNTAGSAFRFNENSADVDFIVETNGNAAAFHIDGGNNNVGVGGAPNANAAFHVNSTGAMLLASGTTAQRPTAVTGMFRYNTTTGGIEYYDSDSWESVSSSFTLATSQTFNGDGSAVAFTLTTLSGSDNYTTAGILVMLNGIVQEPTTVYAISNVTLTFTSAPATGDKIEVRKFTTSTTVTTLADEDGDTQIQLEESSDEDIIRFDAGGTEVARMSSTGIDITASNKELRFYEGANYVGFEAPALSANQIWVLPTADASTSGYALTSNASGTLSWAAAGATVAQDNSTNTAFNLYYAATTSGALTAVKYDGSDMTFNPSTSTLACTTFSGALSGNATTATLAATATILASARTIGGVSFNGSANIDLPGVNAAGNQSTSGLAATATEATNITAVANNSNDETVYPTFVDGATGTQGLETDTGFTYNPSSGTLTSTIFAGTANAAKYADLAERYASDEEIEPGTVVQFVGECKVALCMNDSSRAVAGIVSTDPAYLMNSDQEGISLAIAGRVPCKVMGTVKTGDLMVSAGEGYARAEENPALGTVIGKAIESHSGTTGVIEVLTMMM